MVDPNKIIETVAGGNINVIIQKLASLTIDHVSPLWENSREIEKLKEELQIIHAVLVDMSNEENPSRQEKLWKNKMRELAYDIEDAINSFTQASNNRAQEAQDPNYITRIKNTIQRCTEEIKSLPSCFETANKIKDLKQSLSSMEQRSKRQKTGGNGDGSSHDSFSIRDRAQFADPTGLVGTEGPCDDIVRKLKTKEAAGSSARPRKVVAIVGFGGLGKTTLAKQVFDKIEGNFDFKAFVTVSRNPDIKTVLLNILDNFGLSDDKLHHLRQKGQDRIIYKLREYIKGKRYLVVVDDIWSKDAWESLEAALLDNNCDSNIIVTTRKDEVADACFSSNCNSPVYRLKPLNPEDSKRLFLKRAFRGGETECPPNLEAVCCQMLDRCDGSPLAISVLSGLLFGKVTEEQWENVLNNIPNEDSKYDVVRRIISLSYFDLPQHLRTCLMYLSVFPEDFEISRKRLVNRWIAEGFVSCTGMSITKTAEQYFADLISRNLIQAVDIKYDGEARACRVHDTILDFIISKASEENFVSIIGPQGTREENSASITGCWQSDISDNKVRRLSIQSYEDATKLKGKDLSHVRSITLFGDSKHSKFPLRLQGFTNLRVLDAKNAFHYIIPGAAVRSIEFDVATLPYLKYLDLRGLEWCQLPQEFYRERVLKEIANLQYLQTLDLTGTKVRQLPTDIYKLGQLVRLFIDRQVSLPAGIGQLKALEELRHVWITGRAGIGQFLKELGHLTKMCSMRIDISISLDDISNQLESSLLVSSLEKLSNLQSLRIGRPNESQDSMFSSWQAAFKNLRKLRIGGGLQFTRIPDWMGQLIHLEKLVLGVKLIKQKDLNILGEIQSLLYLELETHEPTKQGLTFYKNKGFQGLKYLTFYCVVKLTFKSGSVPRLEHLDLTINDTGDSTVPGGHVPGIEHLNKLTTVTVHILNGAAGAIINTRKAIYDAVKNLPNKPTPTILEL